MYAQTNNWLGSPANTYRFQSTAGSGSNVFEITLANTTFTAISTNTPYFRFTKEIRVIGGIGSNTGSLDLKTQGTTRFTILSSNGNAGLRTISPNFDFQIHGIYDYLEDNSSSGMGTYDNGDIFDSETKSMFNYGKASRIGLTNTTVGGAATNGGFLMFAGQHFYIRNQQATGNLNLQANGVGMIFSGSTQRIWVGGSPSTTSSLAKFNLITNENGFYVYLTNGSTDRYGITVRAQNENQTIFQSFKNPTATQPDFKVKANGEVFARKYVTTLSNFPDYVFTDSYQLMPLSDLRTYINTYGHLPNMPTAEEVEENGADLGEINRILVEKVEELTLYVLELEQKLEENNATEINERITVLENLIKELYNKIEE